MVAIPSFVLNSEVTGATGRTCSQAPSGGEPEPPLESEETVVVCPSPYCLAHTGVKKCLPIHSPTLWESLCVERKIFLGWSSPPPLPSPTNVCCFSSGPDLLPGSLSCDALLPSPWHTAPQLPESVSTQPTLVPAPELTSGA